MDCDLFVLLPLMGRYVFFFLIPFVLGVTAINSHGVIVIIITVISIIFIVCNIKFDADFRVISICVVFGHVFGRFCSYDIFCIRDAILFLRQVVTRVFISWIFLLSIGCIVSVDINYLCRLILWHIHLLDAVIVIVSHWKWDGNLHIISTRSAM